MNTGNRRRGRPLGTGLKDAPTLARVADLMLANPSLRPTTAIKRVTGTSDPSVIRRLQVKWKADGAWHFAEARARQKHLQQATRAHLMPDRRWSAPSRALDRAYADLGMFGFAGARPPETTVEKEMRKAHERIDALIHGRESTADRMLREAQEGNVGRAMREAAAGIDRTIAEALGFAKGSASLRGVLGGDSSTANMRAALGIDFGSVAMRRALGLDGSRF